MRRLQVSDYGAAVSPLATLAIALTGASVVLYGAMMSIFVVAMRRARDRLRESRRARAFAPNKAGPRVTVFKPLAGYDDDLEENLESFARLDYPDFEILIGVAAGADPALPLAHRFAARHRDLRIRIVSTDPDAARNPKVAQLLGLETVATGEIYVISDSNVRVEPDYLWPLVNELADDRVGIVSNVFAGTGEQTAGAAIENLQLCAATTAGIVAMGVATGRVLTVGKSMAVRRRSLGAIGGFRSVGEVLAEDHLLGRRFLEAGFEPRMCLSVVENRNVAGSIRRSFERHTRWAKLRRSLDPRAFAAEPILCPIVIASIAVAFSPSPLSAGLYAAIVIGQTACALTAMRVLRGHALRARYWPLEVVRSYVVLFCWIRACFSRRIDWRGHSFELGPGSVIVRSPAGPSRTPHGAPTEQR